MQHELPTVITRAHPEIVSRSHDMSLLRDEGWLRSHKETAVAYRVPGTWYYTTPSVNICTDRSVIHDNPPAPFTFSPRVVYNIMCAPAGEEVGAKSEPKRVPLCRPAIHSPQSSSQPLRQKVSKNYLYLERPVSRSIWWLAAAVIWGIRPSSGPFRSQMVCYIYIVGFLA